MRGGKLQISTGGAVVVVGGGGRVGRVIAGAPPGTVPNRFSSGAKGDSVVVVVVAETNSSVSFPKIPFICSYLENIFSYLLVYSFTVHFFGFTTYSSSKALIFEFFQKQLQL